MADVSVRPAVPADAGAVARVQLTTWQAAYGELLPLPLEEADLAAAWAAALEQPPSPQHRVLLALDGTEVVGVASCEPVDDTTAELALLLVEPRWGRRGHGSRLVAAAVDLWRADGVSEAQTWVLEEDHVVQGFLEPAGWGPDTVGRTLHAEDRQVRQRRWATQL